MNVEEKQSITSILLPTELNKDTIAAAFLLQEYGPNAYHDVTAAAISTEAEGAAAESLEAEIKNGVFMISALPQDSSNTGTLTVRMAEHLEIRRRPELQKMIQWVQGETGAEPLATAATKLADLKQEGHEVNEILYNIFPLLQSHVHEQKRYHYNLPDEWAKALQGGQAQVYDMKYGKDPLTVAVIEAKSDDMSGFLFQYAKINADIVVQQYPDKSINVITNRQKNISLENVARIVRAEESRKRDRDISGTSGFFFAREGITEGVVEWYYDTALQQLINRSTDDRQLPPTALTLQDVASAVYIGLTEDVWEKKCPKTGCRGAACYFYAYGLLRCRKREMDELPEMLEQKFNEKKQRDRQNPQRKKTT
ncbi:MAG: hypothetical protein ABIG66_00805 [Candidatus Kerfeldbacteria bacterium]